MQNRKQLKIEALANNLKINQIPKLIGIPNA
ncbi:MAG: hypothetical protein ACD_57C00171G0001 [uncultured bacterium]|nr:MAG: hypothetical protein ACD_57C00171G0001 [uncultured bacterium]